MDKDAHSPPHSAAALGAFVTKLEKHEPGLVDEIRKTYEAKMAAEREAEREAELREHFPGDDDDDSRARNILGRAVKTDRDPTDTSGMDTDDEIWLGGHPEYVSPLYDAWDQEMQKPL